jgi:hypothetical protein
MIEATNQELVDRLHLAADAMDDAAELAGGILSAYLVAVADSLRTATVTEGGEIDDD